MANTYTDEQVASTLALLELNNGNIKRTARETGYPAPTIRVWRDRAVAAGTTMDLSPFAPKERDFAEMWADKEVMVLELIAEKAPEASFRDLSVFAGIAADKHLDYSVGRKGTQVNVNNDNRTVSIVYEDKRIEP